jgi:predicted nucleotidyltransferase
MRLELEVVDLLAGNAGKRFTINEIAKELDGHYSLVHRTVNRLAADGVVSMETAGNSHLCSLDMKNEKAMALLQLGEIEKRDEFLKGSRELKLLLDDFSASVGRQEGVVSVVLFGSYAKGTQAKDSDVDVLVIGAEKKNIGWTVKEMYAKYGKEVNAITMTPQDFRQQREKPIVKEIVRDHVVLLGADRFIGMVFG